MRQDNWLAAAAAKEEAFDKGYTAGVSATKAALHKGVEDMLSDDTDVIISEGEVFVPINTLRKIVSKLEVK